LHRFVDPSEAATTLAVRQGDISAVGFYADHQRIHLGHPGTTAEQAYSAWQSDRQPGRDALLVAPTRELVAQLNERARADRLAATGRPARDAMLSDTTHVSAGDVIFTRHNDRRLVVSDTDWVKNGDRWRVADVGRDGSLTVTQPGRGLGRRIVLPASHVAEHVRLGYATTIHSAQGLTVDTTDVVLSGAESRQSLYVALTRRRSENHIYLADAAVEPDSLPGVDSLNPAPEDILAASSGATAQTLATSTRRILDASATQLRDAVLRYQDALGRAADHMLGQAQLAALDQVAEQLLTGLTPNPPTPPCAVVSRCGRSTGRTRRVYFAGPPNCMNSSRPTIPPPCSTGASATARPSLARCPGSPPYPNSCASTATGAATSPIARVGCVISTRRCMRPPPIQQRGSDSRGRGDSGHP
jgi:hypothetical protein